MCLLPRMLHKYFGSMWCWSQLGERILGGAEISLIQDDINWDFEAQREAKHFAMLHLNPLPPLHALNSIFWSRDLARQPSVLVCGPLAQLTSQEGLPLTISAGDRLLYHTLPGKWDPTSASSAFHLSMKIHFHVPMTMKLSLAICLV